ncbi:hypothetical protein [Streptomyces sp. NPDC088180]|uniref:hypothetical protein n=1 Tax=Streptomyces sp. NPDC088180 TaxID=3365837 RepID=UPI00382B75A3
MSTDARNAWGPLTEGLNIPRHLDLGNRARVLHQLRIKEAAHTHMVTQVHQHLPEREAALLVSSRLWLLLAARMHTLDADGGPLGHHLARLAPDTAAWRDGPPSQTAGLLLAAHHALTTPLDQLLPAGPRVSTTAPDTAALKRPDPRRTGTPPGLPPHPARAADAA